MESELGKRRCDFARLLLFELNPNPSPYDLGEATKLRCFIAEQFQEFWRGQLAVAMAQREIQAWQFAF